MTREEKIKAINELPLTKKEKKKDVKQSKNMKSKRVSRKSWMR